MFTMLVAVAVLIGAPADSVSIFVSAPTRDGFVDTNKEIQDSINDVRGRLSGMKEFRLVNTRDTADIVLTVVTRGVGSESYGQRLQYSEYFKNAELTSTPIIVSTLWVTAVLNVGDYRREFVGTSVNNPGIRLGTWRECARNLADSLKAWAVANADQLRQRRRNQ